MTEVASAFVSIIPSAQGFARRLDSQISGDIDRSGKDAGKRFASGMSASVGGMATKVFAPLAAAAGGIALGSFFKDAIDGASDLQESTTKLDAIFGKASKTVQKFGAGGAKALGQSRQAILDAAATFGTFGKSAGLGGKELAEFSTGFVSLATDLASFNNTSPEEAVQAIGSALRGEAEPLRRYGVLMDDASLKQEALKQGLIKTTKEALTPQNKVLAAQALIYKQTKDAQGDFDKTSGGLANQQRILSAQFTDLKATLGQEFLPVVTRVVSYFNDKGVPALKNFADAVKDALTSKTVKDFTGGAKQIYDALFRGDFTGGPFQEDSQFIDKVFDLREALFKVKDGAQQLFDALYRGDTSGNGPFATGFLGQVVEVREALVVFSDIVADQFEDMRDRVKTVFGGLAETVKSGDFEALGAALGEAIASSAEGLVQNSARLIAGVGAFFKTVAPQLALEFGKQAPTILLGFAAGLLNFDIGSLFSFLGDHLFEVIVGVIVLAFAPAKLLGVFAKIPIIGPLVTTILKSAAGASRALFNAGGRLIRGILDGLERSAPALLGGAIGLLRSLGVVLITQGRLAINGLLGILRGAPGNAQAALAALPGLLGRIAGDAAGLFLKAVLFLPSKFLGLLKSLGGVAVSAIAQAGPKLRAAGAAVIAGFIEGIRAKFEDVKDTLGELTGLLPDWKGPASLDAKILRKSGQLVIGGFITGLEDSYGDVRRSLSGLTDGLAASASVNVTGGAPVAQPAAPGRVVNIYPRSVGDEQQAQTLLRTMRNLDYVGA